MAKFRLCCLNLLMVIGCFGGMILPVESKLHIVGKSFGWRFPSNDSFYQDWAGSRNFTVGDELVFMYTSGTHNLIEVSKRDFEACTKYHFIRKNFKGPTTFVELNRPGNHYYICDFDQHYCHDGMKLAISVMKRERLPLSSSSNGGAELYLSRWIGRLGTVCACLITAVTHALVG